MRKDEIRGSSNQELINRYEEMSRARGQAMTAGDLCAANSAFDEETLILEELRGREPSALPGLLSLLSSEDQWVRMDAAIPALFFAADRAEPVLERLVQSERRALKLTARMSLDQWRKGELKPRPSEAWTGHSRNS
jgi:HEAT repeat protein